MSTAETDEEIARQQFVEDYIKSLNWAEPVDDYMVTIVAGNLRAFWSRVQASHSEMRRRYHEARDMMKKATDAFYREGHEDSETIDVAMERALHWVSQEELEDEIFKSA